MLTEARIQLPIAPRSALVMAVAAAEIGYKQAVATLTPDAAWLALEMPSPSLDRLLREHLPQLPVRARLADSPSCPPSILEELKKAAQIRNGLVHRGAEVPPRARLERIVTAVEDLLWLLDYYCGHTWAAEFLSAETRAAFGKPPGTRPIYTGLVGETDVFSARLED